MDLKLCGGCSLGKPVGSFSWKDKRRKIRHSACRDCHAKYRRQHYLKHREKYIAKACKWNGAQRKKLQAVVFDYLQQHFCVDCGEKDIAVLEFDHRKDKFMGIAQMINEYYSLEKVKREIEKCDVRCANCHRRKTMQERGFWKSYL